MSRIGKKPVVLPSEVQQAYQGKRLRLKGLKGALSFKATDDVDIKVDGNIVTIRCSKPNEEVWCTCRYVQIHRRQYGHGCY